MAGDRGIALGWRDVSRQDAQRRALPWRAQTKLEDIKSVECTKQHYRVTSANENAILSHAKHTAGQWLRSEIRVLLDGEV